MKTHRDFIVFLSFLIILISSSSSQRLSFLRLPSSIQRLEASSSAASLPVDDIESLVANLVGLPSDLDWSAFSSGLTVVSGLDRPKANLLFVVDGVESPTGLGFQDSGVKLTSVDHEAVDDVIDTGFDDLGRRLQSVFKAPPLLLVNAAVESSSSAADSVNGAMEASMIGIDRIAGAMKMNQVFKPRHLNVTESADLRFLAELNDVKFLVDTLSSSSALLASTQDGTPDAFLFRFRDGLSAISAAYGVDSPQFHEAASILRKFIQATASDVAKIYGDQIAVELATIPASLPSSPSSGAARNRVRRAADAASAGAGNPYNLAGKYDWNYAATFNMSLWTGVFLAIILYLISFAMWNMDPGRDGYVYRMTMSKNK